MNNYLLTLFIVYLGIGVGLIISYFTKAELKHNFFVEKIQMPEDMKDSKDFALIREASKRIGRIIREGIIDEEEVKKEFEFTA